MLRKFQECLNAVYTTVENDGSYAVSRRGRTLKLFFEKSNGRIDWLNNIDFPAKPYRDMADLWFCHRGFLEVWKSIEPYVAGYIVDPLIREVEIVGYSHGGAIAALCHEYVKFNRPEVEVSGLGFGAPRVVWGFPNERVLSRFEGFTVVRNGNDFITHLPPSIFGFRHVGRLLEIGESVRAVKDHYRQNYINALIAFEMS